MYTVAKGIISGCTFQSREIRRTVPEHKLLVMNIKEGWEPLCAFLGEETPPWDIPTANDITEWDMI